MANRRMLSNSISTSTRIAEVSTFAKLVFTWLIPHCDDYGHMDGSARMIKAIVMPLGDETVDQVEAALQELERNGLIKRYDHENKKYLEIDKWENHQTFKNDRPIEVRFPLPKDWKPWESIRNPDGNERKSKRREEKRSEDKLREEKGSGPEASIKYLDSIPSEDMKEFVARFQATERQIKGKAEDLKLYCLRKAKIYRDYKAFLLNALKRDFPEREAAAGGKYAKLS